jgi:hypothetical protein
MVRSEKPIAAILFSKLNHNLRATGRLVKNEYLIPPIPGYPFAVGLLGEILQAIRRALYLLDDERPFLLKIGVR